MAGEHAVAQLPVLADLGKLGQVADCLKSALCLGQGQGGGEGAQLHPQLPLWVVVQRQVQTQPGGQGGLLAQ